MSGVQDTLKDGLLPSAEIPSGRMVLQGGLIPARKAAQSSRIPDSPLTKKYSIHAVAPVSKSWSDAPPSSLVKTASFSSAGHVAASAVLQMISPKDPSSEQRVLVFDEPVHERFGQLSFLPHVPDHGTTVLVGILICIFSNSAHVMFLYTLRCFLAGSFYTSD